MKYLVGVDEGTTGCKVSVFDKNGNLVSISGREYASYYPHPGWVEQSIDEIRSAIFSCCREAVAKSNVDPTDIVGISHSNQGITMVLLGEDGKPVMPRTIGWQDLRYVDMLSELKKSVDLDDFWEIAGMEYCTYNTPVLRWLQQNEPEVWGKVRRICSHQDYFLHCYGADGFFIDEGSANMLGMVRAKDSEWDDMLLRAYGVTRDMLPAVVHEPGRIVGRISPDVSMNTGIPVGCAVCLGGLDMNSCTLGAGAHEAGTEVLVMGTAGISILISDVMNMDPNRRLTMRSNPGLGNWQYMIMTNTGASAFRWFRDAICSMEVATSRLIGADPYDLITAAASQSRPGANGVTALTCIQGAHARVKNERARGGFLGINLGTTKADLAEAILEGICFEMRDILDMKEELAGAIKNIRLGGGVAKSAMWCQMFADILGKPVEVTEVQEMGCLGAAMCAGVGTGLFANLRDAIDKCVHVKKTYSPDYYRKSAYDEAFRRWQKIYNEANLRIYNN